MKTNYDLVLMRTLILGACKQAFLKLNPISLYRNRTILLVEIAAFLTTDFAVYRLFDGMDWFLDAKISIALWLTVLVANFAESFTEVRGKAQAEALKKGRSEIYAQRITNFETGEIEAVSALLLKRGEIVVVSEGMLIPSDGEVIEGVALVDESAITGESAPVVREFGGDRTTVTGGTKVLSGTLKIEIKANAGETFIDRMISMVENNTRDKTPYEKKLELFLLGSTVIFVAVIGALPWFGGYLGLRLEPSLLLALLVCLIPTTIGGLLPAVGIAGMDRLLAKNVLVLDGRAVEAAGDVTVILLDKTGTITLGNRLATQFIPAQNVSMAEFSRYAILSSLADDTPEGRSIVVLAKQTLNMRGRDIRFPTDAKFIEFNAVTRMSGINIGEMQIRKGAIDAIEKFVEARQIVFPIEVRAAAEMIAREGGTPLVVADQNKVYGVIYLKDVLKKGIARRLSRLKQAGILSVMVTGDNALTAAAIAAEAGVDDFIAEATPAVNLKRIKKYQEEGYIVAMIGDGVNDAPALAQADVGVAMNVGTQSAQEAANMIDLDSSPTKLLDIIAIGKQLLMTRGAIATFSIVSDAVKCLILLPIIFVAAYPRLYLLNFLHLSTPENAIMATLIFNSVAINALIPLVLRGVNYHQTAALTLLKRNLIYYGVGGVIFTLSVIKSLDWLLMKFL